MDKVTQQVMFSSKTEMWETPQELFDKLNEKYHFDCDVCAIPENTKCKNYYTPEAVQADIQQITENLTFAHNAVQRWKEKRNERNTFQREKRR